MNVGERIKSKRLELGMSQDELAKKCGYKSRSSVNKIELARDLPLNKVELFAKALEVTPAYLMGWEETSQQSKNTDSQSDKIHWYQDPETAEIAQRIFEDPSLRVLFDSAKDAKPEDLATVQAMLEALLRKEGHKD